MRTQRHGFNFPIIVAAVLELSLNLLWAQVAKEFPAHWGPPPAIQTQDYGELPAGYGHGSSTLAKWITANLNRDKAGNAESAKPTTLYENNLEKAEAGKLPDEFMVQEGNFSVKDLGANKVLELPGAPVETFGLFFGPAESSDVFVSAKIFGTGKGRRFPTFGVGLNGPSGHRLMIAPAKKTLELYRNDEFQTGVPCEWKSGEWLNFKLQVRKAKEASEWKVEGKVWDAGAKEPAAWCVTFVEKTGPIAGRASAWGSPISGTPIYFDDFAVSRIRAK